MNKEIPQENIEELDAQDLQVISKLQNLRKDIKAPHESFLKAMQILNPDTSSTPTKSPFYIPMFFRISVPALAVILIVGLSVKNNLNPNTDSILEPSVESPASFALLQNEAVSNSDVGQSQDTALMKMSTVTPENLKPEDFEAITAEEFSTYSTSSDEKFASYDETGVNNFVNYYGENF